MHDPFVSTTDTFTVNLEIDYLPPPIAALR
ncbi:MAG: hypothetical protein ACI8RD_000458 [Bacillariaceae sp.]|jgi:hypothetical protein